VVAAATEQLTGPFHAQLAQILGNRHSHLLRERPAHVERTAADFAADFFQARRFGQARAQDTYPPVHSLARNSLLTVAKQFGLALPREKEFRHELEDFALIPKRTCSLKDMGIKQPERQ